MKRPEIIKDKDLSIDELLQYFNTGFSCFEIENYKSDDLYITLCNTAGALLQGKTVHVFNTTYSGNAARKQGIKLVGLINQLNKVMNK